MKSSLSNPIAEEHLTLTRGGTRTLISARIGRPYHDGDCFRCPAGIEGLEPQYPDIAGESSLQALCLALRLVRDRLEDQLHKGAVLSYPGEDGPLGPEHLAVIFGWTWEARAG
jgi:hypothetical protein